MELDESIDDFNLKYKDTVAELTYQGDDRGLYMIGYMEEDEILNGYTVGANSRWVPFSAHISDVDLKFTMPPLGLVNHRQQVVHVTRRPKKQYRRGFTFMNGVIQTETVEYPLAIKAFGQGQVDHNCELVTSIFDPMYYSPEDALSLIANKTHATVAINNRYYFSASSRLPYIYLGFANGLVIGRVNENNAKCTVFKSATPLLEDLVNYVTVR